MTKQPTVEIRARIPSIAADRLAAISKDTGFSTSVVIAMALHVMHDARCAQTRRGKPHNLSETLTSDAAVESKHAKTRAWLAERIARATAPQPDPDRAPPDLLTGTRYPLTPLQATIVAYAGREGQSDHDLLPEHEHLRDQVEERVRQLEEYAEIERPYLRGKTFTQLPPPHPDYVGAHWEPDEGEQL